ncbi:hypothetical protein [Mesorhizobium sp.]|uniref:hypothetical protein n=1 Tax=Mesorhizobium sp. TaxID=1871066 RepID=UPI0025F600AC|nr:hypothetical protein [Mesorhizobium sp.]
MTVDDPLKRSTLGSVLFCKGPRAALIWLEKAFGFEPSMVVSDADGRIFFIWFANQFVWTLS